METRVAVIAIIIDNPDIVNSVNETIHDYAPYIIGRMGIPYHKKNVNIISLVIDAPQNEISSLSGKLGRFAGVSVKTAYSNVIGKELSC